jgi:hypothetical protein
VDSKRPESAFAHDRSTDPNHQSRNGYERSITDGDAPEVAAIFPAGQGRGQFPAPPARLPWGWWVSSKNSELAKARARRRPRNRPAEKRDQVATPHGFTQSQPSHTDYSRSGRCIAARSGQPMSEMGQSRPFDDVGSMSALARFADLTQSACDVRQVPLSDLCAAANDVHRLATRSPHRCARARPPVSRDRAPSRSSG